MSKIKVTVEVTRQLEFEVDTDNAGFVEVKEAFNVDDKDAVELIASNFKIDNEWISDIGRVPNKIQYENCGGLVNIDPFSGVIVLDNEVVETCIQKWEKI